LATSRIFHRAGGALTLPAFGTDQRIYTHYLWSGIALGLYTLNAYVGPDPGFIHEDSDVIEVVP